jgi:hypothetical protein
MDFQQQQIYQENCPFGAWMIPAGLKFEVAVELSIAPRGHLGQLLLIITNYSFLIYFKPCLNLN